MRILTENAIDISESLAVFLLGSHLHNNADENVKVEKRLKYVDTGKFSIADLYIPSKDCAVEVKSIAHGNSALKGVVQASMYKEQTDDAIFCMQKPRRKQLREGLEGLAQTSGVGVVYIVGVPNICAKRTVERATGGVSKPFELWKESTYRLTRNAIIARSKSNWIKEYMATLEQVIQEKHDEIFEFAVEPDSSKSGLGDLHPIM